MQDTERLNEAQQRRLYASCRYIDGLLCGLEQALHQADSLSSFPRYVVDLTAAEVSELEEHIRRIRVQLLRALAWQQMSPDTPEIAATHAALTSLTFIDIAIEELTPRHLRGCGAVPEGAIEGLNGVIGDLRSVTRGMGLYIQQKTAAREAEINEG